MGRIRKAMAKGERFFDRVRILRENHRLKSEYLTLVKNLSGVMEVIEETLRVAREVKTAEESMKARAEANKQANLDFQDYRDAYAREILRKKRAAAGDIISSVMTTIMNIDSRSKKIPWVYYDFLNQTLYQSPASMGFFKIREKESQLTLRDLLSFIRQEDRVAVEESLRSGEGLKHRGVWTSKRYTTDSKQLFLSTYPFYLGSKEALTKVIGSAIFLYDPASYSFRRVRVSRFANQVKAIADKRLEQLASDENYSGIL